MSAPAPGEGGSTSSGAPPASSGDANETNTAAAAAAAEGDNLDDVFDETEALSAIEGLAATAIQQRTQMINSDLRVYQSECTSLKHDVEVRKRDIADNTEKIKMNRQLPHLVATVAEVMKYSELDDEIPDESVGGAVEEVTEGDDHWAVLKTTSRQTIFLPMIGLVDAKDLSPTDLVGVNKDSYLVLDKLPAEYDSRAQAMEVDERPTDSYADIGGLDKQIQELIEAIVLPVTHKERFDAIGIQPPKGVLLHGPPGTGKTLLARACAAATKATFLKLAGPSLVQMYIGDGAKIIRDAFSLARSKSPAVIFIDEIDAVGTKRSGGGEHSGVREVQRTMLELLNQLDGFTSDTTVKVIAATNRPDVLDPALMRSGRLDRKIELPHPNEDARGRILQIHARKMTYNKEEINFGELARSTDDFNAAQLKAVAVEAGMEALRRGGTKLSHEDFVAGIGVVAAKKKCDLNYYA